MRKTLPHLLVILSVTCILWTAVLIPVQAQPPNWSGNDELAFLLEVNGISARNSNASSPIPVNISIPVTLVLNISVGEDLTLHTGTFTMNYMGIPIANSPFTIGTDLSSGTEAQVIDTTLDVGSMLGGIGGLGLVSGTIEGIFTFTYSLQTTPGVNATVSDNFVLQIGQTGPASLMTVSGLITVGFTVMSVFSLLLALDEFQRGILAARKVRGASNARDVGVFPKAVVLRRKPGKKEKIDKDALIQRVSQVAGADVAKHAPKALKAVPFKSKITVGKFSRKLRLKHDEGGALAAALVDMGIFRTKSVKIPLKKVAFSGMSLAGSYWSWMQILGNATPDWIMILLYTAAGLVVSVLVGYFMGWMARMPELGYDK
ncbi:MAG: hypothetical protein ACXABF_09035 [Candidatus Thorarchaeota archaeon]